MPEPLTAAAIRARLDASASDAERAKIQARMTDDRNEVIGVRMGTVFKIARDNERMPLPEVDLLLDSDAYEMRIVAVSVLDFRARRRDADRRRCTSRANCSPPIPRSSCRPTSEWRCGRSVGSTRRGWRSSSVGARET